jgi:hypothetical protein
LINRLSIFSYYTVLCFAVNLKYAKCRDWFLYLVALLLCVLSFVAFFALCLYVKSVIFSCPVRLLVVMNISVQLSEAVIVAGFDIIGFFGERVQFENIVRGFLPGRQFFYYRSQRKFAFIFTFSRLISHTIDSLKKKKEIFIFDSGLFDDDENLVEEKVFSCQNSFLKGLNIDYEKARK